MEFPPIPSWEAAHPLVVHFPIALLLVVPLFAVAGLVHRESGRGFRLTALILMALGTCAATLAVSSGEAAETFARGASGTSRVMHQHEEQALAVRAYFVLLTVGYALLLAVEKRRPESFKPPVRFGLFGIHLALYLVACLTLVNAAHLGGRLVHEFGVRAVEPGAIAAPDSD
ncbi:hypothetical protein ABI59_00565 [Acidobacteria bacterium Mor1]|nr:hypothetical protein ABI59_00565 [Acidobacteria bacterium Mor1]